ncbi:MAG: hypothetical protein ACE368_08410 [Paracoccaceae bacterium]
MKKIENPKIEWIGQAQGFIGSPRAFPVLLAGGIAAVRFELDGSTWSDGRRGDGRAAVKLARRAILNG